MSREIPERRVTVLFDVDNTLVDNDRAKADLSKQIAMVLGSEGECRFWELYEEVRRDRGLVNIPLLLAHYDKELEGNPALSGEERRVLRFALADLVMGFPYADYLFPGAVAVLRAARGVGTVALLSEGDATFQPHKIWRTGLEPEVDGNVLVFDRKLEHLDELTAAFPADHYVLVEDKPDILEAVKAALGDRVTTVLVRQGKYANVAIEDDERPDVIVDKIGDLTQQDFARFAQNSAAEASLAVAGAARQGTEPSLAS